jgi:hypothetical protein
MTEWKSLRGLIGAFAGWDGNPLRLPDSNCVIERWLTAEPKMLDGIGGADCMGSAEPNKSRDAMNLRARMRGS